MNSRTIIMMTLMLGLNWGGFIFLLWYGAKRANKQ
jgi:arginine exporter protein ArgO